MEKDDSWVRELEEEWREDQLARLRVGGNKALNSAVMNDYDLYSNTREKYMAVLAVNYRAHLLQESGVEEMWINARKSDMMHQSNRKWDELDDPESDGMDEKEAIDLMTPKVDKIDQVKIVLGVVNKRTPDIEGELKTWEIENSQDDEMEADVAIHLMTPPQHVDKLE